MLEPKGNGNNNQNEEVLISSKALKKIIIHSLLFSEPLTGFRMVMGMLGGTLIEGVVSVHKSICTSVGSYNRVSPEPISYVDISIFNNNLMEEDMFIVGWYLSMTPEGFYCETNMRNHSNWQTVNQKAIVIVIYPELFHEQNYKHFIKVLRLKDIKSSDYSSKNWIDLSIKMLDTDFDQFIQDTTSQWTEINEIIGSNDQDKINHYFKEWKLFNFEEKNNIISKLMKGIVIDETLYSLYFTKDELKTLYYLIRGENPDPEDLEILKKINKDTEDIPAKVGLNKQEMRKAESYMQERSLGYIPGFDISNREHRIKFGGIRVDIINKLRSGYTD